MWMSLSCDLNRMDDIEKFKHHLVNLPSAYHGLRFHFINLDFNRHKEILKRIASWIPPHVQALRIDAQEVVQAKNAPQWQEFIATLPIDTLSFFWGSSDLQIQPQHVTDFLLFANEIKNIKKIIFPNLSSKKSVKPENNRYDLSPLSLFQAITSWSFSLNSQEDALFFLTWLDTKPVIERLYLSTPAHFPTSSTIKDIASRWGNQIKELGLEHFLGKSFFCSGAERFNLFKSILTLESLNLANNALEENELPELIGFLKTLPDNLYHLSLAKNFSLEQTEKLQNLLAYLPGELRVLDLSGNDLRTLDDQFFSSAQLQIHTIKLSHTNIVSFKGLPSSVETLVYSHKASIDWRTDPKEFVVFLELIATLPASVTHLDSSHNGFDKLTHEQLQQFKRAIPEHIKQVYMGANDLFINKNPTQLESTLNLLDDSAVKIFHGESPENYVDRSRRKWKGLDDYPKAKSLDQLIEKKKNNAEDNELLVQLTQKVGFAVSEYKAWSINKIDKRGPEGWFSRWRHGSTGVQRAERLSTTIESCACMEDAIKGINQFLKDKRTRYHNHSFACFLLDQLTTLKEMEWHDTYVTEYPRYKIYPAANP